jgi:hypothetical protein
MARHIRGTNAARKLNYKWWANDLDGGVFETPEAPDKVHVFATFTEARRALGDHFDARAKQFNTCRYLARKFRKAGIENGEITL